MLSSEPRTSVLGGHHDDPHARMPPADVLRHLSPAEVRLLKSTLAEPLDYIPHELLTCPDAQEVLLDSGGRRTTAPMPAGATADDSGLYCLVGPPGRQTRLDREQLLFLRLNFCRRRVGEVLQRNRAKRLNATATHELLHWGRMVHEIRGQIVRENTPLVLAMAKRTKIRGVDPSDLISEGNLALLRAVNKFDCSRGYKFSTYACRAILKSFSRVAARASRYRGHFPTEYDPSLEKSDHVNRRRVVVEDDCINELRAILDEKLGRLTEVEQQVIRARFAIDADGDDPTRKGRTLEQVGEMIGVTKERVRQIQNKALLKLRAALDEAVLS